MVDGIAMWASPPYEGKILIFPRMISQVTTSQNLQPQEATCEPIFFLLFYVFLSCFRVWCYPKQPPAEDKLQQLGVSGEGKRGKSTLAHAESSS